MGLLTKREFAEKAGIKTKVLSVYITRRKVIVGDDDLIDDKNPMNIQFIRNMEVNNAGKPKTDAEPKASEEEPAKTAKMKSFPGKTPKSSDVPDKYDEKLDLDKEKARASIEKARREARLMDMQHEKLIGKLIPTDVVKTLFIQAIKAYTTSYKQSVDKISMEFAKKGKFSRNEIAEMKSMIVTVINRASEDAMNETRRGLDNIVQEYSKMKES